jgi:hypothetical protein
MSLHRPTKRAAKEKHMIPSLAALSLAVVTGFAVVVHASGPTPTTKVPAVSTLAPSVDSPVVTFTSMTNAPSVVRAHPITISVPACAILGKVTEGDVTMRHCRTRVLIQGNGFVETCETVR